jgi:hypothetical protein
MINLGQKVRCTVTGFEGIATAECKYLNGCLQYCVKPKMGADGKMPDGVWLDVQQLEVVEDGVRIKSRDGGGEMSDKPKTNYAP